MPGCVSTRFWGTASAVLLLGWPGQDLAGQVYPTEAFDALEWESVGPNRGGRSIAAAGTVARPLEYYFGATGGGLWKTTDGGNTWEPVTDGKITSSSIGALGICETDPDIVYIGGGETQLRGNIQQGDGVYGTTDGGETWTHLGLRETQNIARIRVHPTDCNTAWVAGFGVHSAENPERGIYKTTDGGESWNLVLHRDARTGGVDISVHPTNPDIVYAGLWEAWRKSWGMSSGGPGSGLFRSTDGGETWTEITRNPGLPQEGMIGKVGVSVSPVDESRVYAIIENDEGGVFRSDDGGETWTQVNTSRDLRQRAFYYTRIVADPQELDKAYVLNVNFWVSSDGGEEFERVRNQPPHGDNHDLWIALDDNRRMIQANDGGANVTVNGAETWTMQDFPTAQFYRVITTHHEPYHICGAQQDNSTLCMPYRGWDHLTARGPSTGPYFYAVGGGESGYIAPDPVDTNVFYAGSYSGTLTRYDHANGQSRSVNVWPENPMGESSEDRTERFQWTFPIVYDHHDPSVLYVTSQKVWKTTNGGHSWEAISPDLTRAAPETLGPSGGPITRDQTGVETYGTIFALAPSYHDPGVLWAGSDDGLVHVTRDGGATWTNVTPPDAPDFVRINTIEASPNTPGKAYVSGIRYLVDNDRSPYVWRTEDFGATWTKIVNGIPEDDFIRATREDPQRPGLLFAGSERTVYVSWDDGATWQSLGLNLPVVQVSDLVVEDHDLVIGTHGRSFWVLPYLEPIRQMNDMVASSDVHLFDPVDPTRGIDQGLTVYYYLGEDAEEVTIEFLEADGDVIASYTGTSEDEAEDEEDQSPFARYYGGGGDSKPGVEAGSHSFTWNMRYPGFTEFVDMILWAAGNVGPRAVPGGYQVRLSAHGQTQTQDVEIKLDPRLEDEVTIAQLQERFDFAMTVRDRVSVANSAVLDIRDIKGQVDDRLERTETEEIHEVGGEVKTKLSEVEQEIYQVRNEARQDPLNYPVKLNNKLASLIGMMEAAENEPTEGHREVYQYLSSMLQEELARMDVIIETDLQRLNELLRNEDLPPINPDPVISDDHD
jgi:photosystem II stability/assembly factor-like uncharacterized protein